MYLKRAVSFVFLILSCSPAVFGGFDFVDGVSLATQCRIYIRVVDGTLQSPTKGDFVDAGKCIAYVEGVVDTIQDLRRSPLIPKRTLFCAPDEMTGQEAVRITLKYLDDHPEGLHFAASSEVWTALHTAFPCPAR
jgi:hypothetical protein